MPNFNQNYQHAQVPQQPGGYELANQGGLGFWSIVSPLGVVTNLNSLGIKVMGYTGGGMPPIENITTPFGLLGGSLLQRTVARPRTIALICAVQQENYAYVQRVLQSIINQVAPSTTLQTAQDLKLRFQLLNYQGKAAGTVLDTPVVYQGGLEGSVSGLYEERFTLVFLDLNPPDTVETATLQPSLTLNNTASSHIGYEWRNTLTGQWNIVNVGNGAVNSLMYDASGDLWFGNSNTQAKVATRSGSVSQAVAATVGANTVVNAIVQAADGTVYIGGNFNTPQAFIMKYSAGSFSALSNNITDVVNGLAVVPQPASTIGYFLFAVGQFSLGNGVAFWNGTNWGTIGTGPSPANSATIVRVGNDGMVYFGGSFTSFNGVTTNGIVKYNPVALTTAALGAGLSVGPSVYDIQPLPDGRIAVFGALSIPAGGGNNIAFWNGTSWSVFSPGFDNSIRAASVDQATGDIYIVGPFTKLLGDPYPITTNSGRYNGGLIYPLDIAASPAALWRSALRSTDKELATAVAGSTTLTYAGSFSFTYAGTAEAVPQIKLTGPGTFYMIKNYTTGKTISFNNLNLQPGEVATLTMTGAISFKSSFPQAGTNILNKILQGSDITLFSLLPGVNNLDVLTTGTTGATKVEFIYKNTHWSIDAGA